MKDLIVRIFVGALVGSLVSAGVLYFAFDQAMRGVETSVSENGNWSGEVSQKIDVLAAELRGQSKVTDDKVDELIKAIAESTAIERLEKINTIHGLNNLKGQLAGSIRTNRGLIEVFLTTVPQGSAEFGQMSAMIEQMKEQENMINEISFDGDGLIRGLTLSPTTP